MDNQAIGNYIKRLRLRAGQTQADLGTYLHVTDKAISRWESGVGMPEIGTLMTIARIYGIKVDDILECNEAIFGGAPVPPAYDGGYAGHPYAGTDGMQPQTYRSSASQPNANVSPYGMPYAGTNLPPDPAQNDAPRYDGATGAPLCPSRPLDPIGANATAHRTAKKTQYCTDKFLTALFFLYLVVGMTTFTIVDFALLPILYLFTFLTTGAAIVQYLSAKWKPAVRAGILTAIYGCILVVAIIYLIMIFSRFGLANAWDSAVYHNADAHIWLGISAIVWVTAAIMQLLYAISELCGDRKIPVTVLRCYAFGLACALTVAVIVLDCIDTSTFTDLLNEHVTGGCLLGINIAAVVLPLFAAGQAFIRPFYIAAGGCMAIGTVFFLALQVTLNDLVFYVPDISTVVFLVLAVVSSAVSSGAYFAEGRRGELLTARICAGISLAFLLPLLVYTIDALAGAAILGLVAFPQILALRIVTVATAVTVYVGRFRFELFFKKRKKEALR